jgi:RNA polymerase sigma factor (TIGR02999 family)
VDPLTSPSTTLAADNRAALDAVFSELYPELSELAHRQRLHWRGNLTLSTTALIHEAWLKLAGREQFRIEGRPQFVALAARVMRHILINYARDRRALKRGGADSAAAAAEWSARVRVSLTAAQADELLTLHEALDSLAAAAPRQARVVECRFFGGLSVEETASALGISEKTVKRDWAVAQAWLQRRMEAADVQPS